MRFFFFAKKKKGKEKTYGPIKYLASEFTVILLLIYIWPYYECGENRRSKRNIVGSEEVGFLGELFMLPYCTCPPIGLPRPQTASDAKHVTYQKREIFQGLVFWGFPRTPENSTEYSDTRSHLTFWRRIFFLILAHSVFKV